MKAIIKQKIENEASPATVNCYIEIFDDQAQLWWKGTRPVFSLKTDKEAIKTDILQSVKNIRAEVAAQKAAATSTAVTELLNVQMDLDKA